MECRILEYVGFVEEFMSKEKKLVMPLVGATNITTENFLILKIQS